MTPAERRREIAALAAELIAEHGWPPAKARAVAAAAVDGLLEAAEEYDRRAEQTRPRTAQTA